MGGPSSWLLNVFCKKDTFEIQWSIHSIPIHNEYIFKNWFPKEIGNSKDGIYLWKISKGWWSSLFLFCLSILCIIDHRTRPLNNKADKEETSSKEETTRPLSDNAYNHICFAVPLKTIVDKATSYCVWHFVFKITSTNFPVWGFLNKLRQILWLVNSLILPLGKKLARVATPAKMKRIQNLRRLLLTIFVPLALLAGYRLRINVMMILGSQVSGKKYRKIHKESNFRAMLVRIEMASKKYCGMSVAV